MRASDKAYNVLRGEIIEWELPPGTILGEVEQSIRIGVSRTPLREALARLTADGLVSSQAGRGLVVTDVSIENIRELYEVRRSLDELAARLAAERADTNAFASLEEEFKAVPMLLESADPARHDYYALVSRLDDAIDDAVGNPYLVGALGSLRTHLVRIRRLAKDDTARLRAAAAEHLLIVQAIRARDSELAAHATHIHLHRALQHVLAASRPLERTAS